MKTISSLQMSSSDSARPVAGSVAAIRACTSGASRVGSARQACRISSASRCRVALAARARRRAGVGSHRGARIGRSGPIGDIGQCDAQRLGDRVGALVEVQPEHRAAQRPQGQSAAFGVEVDFRSVEPTVGDRLCGLGHVAAESRGRAVW